MYYRVTYEARKAGAIGLFSPRTVNVITATPEDACRVAFDSLHNQGYETRCPMGIIEVPTPCCCDAWETYPGTDTDESRDCCPQHGHGANPQPERKIPWPVSV